MPDAPRPSAPGQDLPPHGHQRRPQPPDVPQDDREKQLPDVDPEDAPENPGDHAPVREPGDPPDEMIAGRPSQRQTQGRGEQSQEQR